MARNKKETSTHKGVDQELKKIIDRNERSQLLFETEALLRKSDPSKELEKYQLQNGFEFTQKDIDNLIREAAREYFPMFPNKKPFFKLMYKLLGWTSLDPNAFMKPPCVAIYIKQYIYGRFDKDVLPTLLNKHNPVICGFIKQYKLFQFLNDQGILLLEKYIEEAIEEMEKATSWYEFELNYSKKYALSVQLKCLPQ